MPSGPARGLLDLMVLAVPGGKGAGKTRRSPKQEGIVGPRGRGVPEGLSVCFGRCCFFAIRNASLTRTAISRSTSQPAGRPKPKASTDGFGEGAILHLGSQGGRPLWKLRTGAFML